MKTQPIKSLDTLMSGAVSERFADELARTLENVLDPNTDPKKTRKITLTLTIKPNKDRNVADFAVEAKSTLAAPIPVATTAYIGKNKKGDFVAEEVVDEIPGQLDIYGEETTPNMATFPQAKQN